MISKTDLSCCWKKYWFLQIKKETWKNHITKTFCQITSQKHIKNLPTTFITVSIWKWNILQKKLEIADRVDYMAQKPAYKTLKDYEENVNISHKCHLINPAKRKLGKVAKKL